MASRYARLSVRGDIGPDDEIKVFHVVSVDVPFGAARYSYPWDIKTKDELTAIKAVIGNRGGSIVQGEVFEVGLLNEDGSMDTPRTFRVTSDERSYVCDLEVEAIHEEVAA